MILEPARKTPIIHKTEVLVVGSGPGGLAAAVAAARAGVSVCLVERYGCFGGNITAVGVEGFAWYRHENTVDSEGLGIEFEERARSINAGVPEPQSQSFAIDGESFKHVADEFVCGAGITPMLHRMFVAPIMKDECITGIITESKAGREAILADRVVDASGDADVCFGAGAPTIKTPIEDMMGVSVMFSMSGVNKREFIESIKKDPQTYSNWNSVGWQIKTTGKEDNMFSPYIKKPFDMAKKAGMIPEGLQTIGSTWGAIHDTGDLTYLNLVHLQNIDGTKPDDLTKGEIEGRRQAVMAVNALKSFHPGCEKAKLRNFGMTLGIRDTRKINAVYNMSAADVTEQGRFEDSVGIFPEFIDGYGILVLPTTGRYYQLPYRSLLPKKVNNLIAAGRITGGDKTSHASTRNMMCCTVTGQAAGISAAISVKLKKHLRDLSISELSKELDKQRVRTR